MSVMRFQWDEKAIRVPSGDHRGCTSFALEFVRRVTLLPSAFITWISPWPRESLTRYMVWKAIRVPSGDHAGLLPVWFVNRPGTVTQNDTVLDSPSGSRAVTVTVAVPGPTPVPVTALRPAVTVATARLDDDEYTSNRSPFPSSKHTGTRADAPTWTAVSGGTEPHDTGARGFSQAPGKAATITARAGSPWKNLRDRRERRDAALASRLEGPMACPDYRCHPSERSTTQIS